MALDPAKHRRGLPGDLDDPVPFHTLDRPAAAEKVSQDGVDVCTTGFTTPEVDGSGLGHRARLHRCEGHTKFFWA